MRHSVKFQAPQEEKASHFAGDFVAVIGVMGGGVALMLAMWVFGEERVVASDIGLLGSFLIGTVAGVVAGWKLVMPRRHPEDE